MLVGLLCERALLLRHLLGARLMRLMRVRSGVLRLLLVGAWLLEIRVLVRRLLYRSWLYVRAGLLLRLLVWPGLLGVRPRLYIGAGLLRVLVYGAGCCGCWWGPGCWV